MRRNLDLGHAAARGPDRRLHPLLDPCLDGFGRRTIHQRLLAERDARNRAYFDRVLNAAGGQSARNKSYGFALNIRIAAHSSLRACPALRHGLLHHAIRSQVRTDRQPGRLRRHGSKGAGCKAGLTVKRALETGISDVLDLQGQLADKRCLKKGRARGWSNVLKRSGCRGDSGVTPRDRSDGCVGCRQRGSCHHDPNPNQNTRYTHPYPLPRSPKVRGRRILTRLDDPAADRARAGKVVMEQRSVALSDGPL